MSTKPPTLLALTPPSLSPPGLSHHVPCPLDPLARPSPQPRSAHTRSQSTGLANKRWQPTVSTAVTGTAKLSQGKGCARVRGPDVASSLSTCWSRIGVEADSVVYVSSERMTSGDPCESTGWSWGESLVQGAVSATVFSAALALTAYRLLATRIEAPTPIAGHTADGTEPRTEGHAARLPSVEYPPPPAYEELAKSYASTKQDEIEWEEEEGPELIIPSQSASSIKPHPKVHSRQPSLSTPYLTLSSQAHRRRPSKRISHPSRSIPTFIVQDHLSSSLRPADIAVAYLAPDSPAAEDEEEEEGDKDGLVSRLDDMSERLRDLIREGQKALAAESPMVSGVGEGWVDATPMREGVIEWTSP